MSDLGIIKSYFKCGDTPYTVEWGIEADKRIEALEAELEAVQCDGYNCCPLASENKALEAEVERLRDENVGLLAAAESLQMDNFTLQESE